MAKLNVRSVIEVSHPQHYNIDKLRWEDLYVKVLKLSEAKELCRYLKIEKRPYIIVTMSGMLDDDIHKREKMRLFCIFTPYKWKGGA
jgi:hypothetical protein